MPYCYAKKGLELCRAFTRQPGKPNWFCAYSIGIQKLSGAAACFAPRKQRTRDRRWKLPRLAQGRAQSAQRRAQRGQRPRHHRARCERCSHGRECRSVAERVDQIMVRNVAASQSNRNRRSHARPLKPIVEYFTGFLGDARRSATLPLCKRATLRVSATAKRKSVALDRQSLRESFARLLRRSGAARFAHRQSCFARQASEIDQRIQAACLHALRNQAHLESVR